MKITLQKDEISKKLENFIFAVRPDQLAGAIGNIAVRDIKEHFQTKTDSNGNQWVPLSPLTLAWRRKGKGSGGAETLKDTGQLFKSINYRKGTNGALVDIISSRMNKGVNIAAVQNFGVNPYSPTKKQRAWFRYQGVHLKPDTWMHIPAREFWYISQSAIAEMQTLRDKIVNQL